MVNPWWQPFEWMYRELAPRRAGSTKKKWPTNGIAYP